jgi:hypothetical protein
MKLCDDEQLTAVLLEGQVAEPLEHLWHLLGASAGSSEQWVVIPALALVTRIMSQVPNRKRLGFISKMTWIQALRKRDM